ncbi:MAG: restriction endonuclease subunit S [Desulfobacteraceae bacterium]|jgi:type I restriction enzyme S subunit
MQDRNANRPGYRKTLAGWIPNDWQVLRVRDVGAVQAGRQRSPHFTEGKLHPYLRVANIYDGYIDSSDVMKMMFTEEEFHRYRLRNGDILLNEGQSLDLVGRCAKYMGMPPNCCFQNTLIRFRPNGLIQEDFCQILFTHLQKSGAFSKIASQTTSIAHLGVSRFANLCIPVPTFEEQKKIVKIFFAWDAVIDKICKLISSKKNRKKALMQNLLTGKKRLPGFAKPWKEYCLGDLFSERRETNGDHLPLLAITGKRGVIPASDIDRKDSSSADKSRYKRIFPGDIGYNTMRMWQGVSAVSDLEGIVSPAYTICKPKKGVNTNFFGYLFKLPSVVHLFWRHSQGLVSDTLNLKFHNLAQIKIKAPGIQEQDAIAKALLAIDDDIMLQEKKLAATEKQKRGLMQKLLTGEVRVKT